MVGVICREVSPSVTTVSLKDLAAGFVLAVLLGG
jgi:hypothetical protein